MWVSASTKKQDFLQIYDNKIHNNGPSGNVI